MHVPASSLDTPAGVVNAPTPACSVRPFGETLIRRWTALLRPLNSAQQAGMLQALTMSYNAQAAELVRRRLT